MQRQRRRKDNAQLEFPALVAAAEIASYEMAGQLQVRRRLERDRLKAIGLLETPWRYQHGFDNTWMKAVAERILQSTSLREGIVVTASRLAELLDLEIEGLGMHPHWKEKYDAFCAYKLGQQPSLEAEADKVLRAFWDTSAEIFKTYYALDSMNDAQLLEHICSGAVGDLKETDPSMRQTVILAFYSEIVFLMRRMVTRDASPEE